MRGLEEILIGGIMTYHNDQAAEIERKAYQEAHANLLNLLAELVALPKDEKNPFTYEFDSGAIISTGRDKADILVNFPIAEDARYKKVRIYYALKRQGYSYTSGYKTFVRIETDHWEVRHKHNWTFQTKDLAKKVHDRVAKFVKELKHLDDNLRAKKSDAEKVKEFMENKFKDSVYPDGSRGSVFTKWGKVEYNLNGHKFSIELSGLTEDQFDRILAIKQESDNGAS